MAIVQSFIIIKKSNNPQCEGLQPLLLKLIIIISDSVVNCGMKTILNVFQFRGSLANSYSVVDVGVYIHSPHKFGSKTTFEWICLIERLHLWYIRLFINIQWNTLLNFQSAPQHCVS